MSEQLAIATAYVPASGSSFYTAMRIMPKRRRDALFQIYAFCRAVDDVADGSAPIEDRVTALQNWRKDIDAIYDHRAPSHLAPLALAVEEYRLRRKDFMEVIAGMEMDVKSPIRAPDWKTLDLYCDRVASAVGRLCVCVFGMDRKSGERLAHHLGRALQLTNILRDIDEDASVGRLYLPLEALRKAGISSTDPNSVIHEPGLDVACKLVSARAQAHYAAADTIMARSPRRVVRCPSMMSQAYRHVLARLIQRGWQAPRSPVRTSRWRVLFILLRHYI